MRVGVVDRESRGAGLSWAKDGTTGSVEDSVVGSMVF